MLGLDDDLALRRAIERVPARAPAVDVLQPERRPAGGSKARAQIALAAVEREAPRARDRSIAANLIGVLAFQEARGDPIHAAEAIQRAAQAFRRAILADGANEDAKSNLELILRPASRRTAQLRRQQSGVSRQRTRRTAPGAGRGGSGY